MAKLCEVGESHLGNGERAPENDVDYYCPAPKGGMQLYGDLAARSCLEIY